MKRKSLSPVDVWADLELRDVEQIEDGKVLQKLWGNKSFDTCTPLLHVLILTFSS